MFLFGSQLYPDLAESIILFCTKFHLPISIKGVVNSKRTERVLKNIKVVDSKHRAALLAECIPHIELPSETNVTSTGDLRSELLGEF